MSGRLTGRVSCKSTRLKRCSVTEMRWNIAPRLCCHCDKTCQSPRVVIISSYFIYWRRFHTLFEFHDAWSTTPIVIGCNLVKLRRKMNMFISGRSHITVVIVNDTLMTGDMTSVGAVYQTESVRGCMQSRTAGRKWTSRNSSTRQCFTLAACLAISCRNNNARLITISADLLLHTSSLYRYSLWDATSCQKTPDTLSQHR